MNKVLKSILVIYIVQIIFSCGYDVTKIKIIHKSLYLNVTKDNKYTYAKSKCSFAINYFYLNIEVISEHETLSYINFNDLSFQSSMAMLNGGPPPEYIVENPIMSIEIIVAGTRTDEQADVTDLFKLTHLDKEIFVSEIQLIDKEFRDYLFVYPIKDSEFPKYSKFIVKVHLKSGTVFTQETSEIEFYDGVE
ncbi:MAG: hypothetical protein HRT66_02605 [Flavobacteriaceae bacterium]|nr:hypothetical protein [Flavobacteriaceae bacterium]